MLSRHVIIHRSIMVWLIGEHEGGVYRVGQCELVKWTHAGGEVDLLGDNRVKCSDLSARVLAWDLGSRKRHILESAWFTHLGWFDIGSGQWLKILDCVDILIIVWVLVSCHWLIIQVVRVRIFHSYWSILGLDLSFPLIDWNHGSSILLVNTHWNRESEFIVDLGCLTKAVLHLGNHGIILIGPLVLYCIHFLFRELWDKVISPTVHGVTTKTHGWSFPYAIR